MGLSETGRWLLDTSEVLRLPGRRSLILYRRDILGYSMPAAKISYRSWGIGAGAKVRSLAGIGQRCRSRDSPVRP